MNTENLSTLKIYRLTQAQYNRELEAGNLDATALYLTPDELDTTLTQSGKAADAKAVGDALAEKQPKGNYLITEADRRFRLGLKQAQSLLIQNLKLD